MTTYENQVESLKNHVANVSLAERISLANNVELKSVRDLNSAFNYEIRVVCGNANRKLAEDVAKNLHVGLTDMDVTRFADGEISVRINEPVRGKDVFIIQPTSPPVNDSLMELLIIIDTLKRASAKRITAVVPYYGYGRQNRKTVPRVPITARLVADIIQTAGAHRLLTLELHAGQIQGFFDIPVDHIYAMKTFSNCLKKKGIVEESGNTMVVSPDAGGIERARSLAKVLDVELAIVDKRSLRGDTAHVMRIIGNVKDRNCIIVNDIVDTAGTLTEAAKALRENGAKRITACCVHPLLSPPAVERIEESEIGQMIVTDSIVVPTEKMLPKMVVITVAELIAESISRIHGEESVSMLFD